MTVAAVLECTGLTKSYGRGAGRVRALAHASLSVSAGELVIVRGPSGSGKTTLLNLIGGLDRPDSGAVRLAGRELTDATEDELVELRRREIGFVFQTFALLPVLSARENVDLPLRLAGWPARERASRVDEMLESVGLSDHAEQRPLELSGGQQQRLGIARALATSPRLLLADEPTGQLDSANADAMMRLIAHVVHAHDVAAVVSTHDPRMAAHADRIVTIRDGELSAQ